MRGNAISSILLAVLAYMCCMSGAQGQKADSLTLLDWRRGTFPKEKDNEIYQIKASGFYRFFAT